MCFPIPVRTEGPILAHRGASLALQGLCRIFVLAILGGTQRDADEPYTLIRSRIPKGQLMNSAAFQVSQVVVIGLSTY